MERKISAVIITYNAAKTIGKSVAALQGVVNEIVLVDSYSTDATVSICEAEGCKVFSRTFEGYGDQKNFGNKQAKFPYILSVDADEVLNEELRNSILAFKNGKLHGDLFSVFRLNYYCGTWIKHGDWYPDIKVRLWKKDLVEWDLALIHEKPVFDKTLKPTLFKGQLLHYSFYSVEEHLSQIDRYTSLKANDLFAKGKRFSWWKCYLKPLWKFMKSYFLRTGFLDGKAGWLISKNSAYGVYLQYKKLAELEKSQGK